MERAADDRGAPVFLGVDTHSDAHVAVALDVAGRRLGELALTNDRTCYARLWEWVLGFGDMVTAGVEGTGSYGAGLSRFLRAVASVEVSRSTMCRAIGRMNSTRKKGGDPLQNATSS